MPSMTVAAGLLALSSMAAAFPQGGFSNGTAGAVGGTGSVSAVRPISTGTSSSSDPVTEAAFCPKLSGSVVQSKTGLNSYLLNCNTNYFGTVITVTFNSTAFVNKRQTAVAPANIQDCIAACDTIPTCVGTAFDTAARTCALYSQVGASYAAAGTDFAVRVGGAATTATAGQALTTTAYSTTVKTVSSCAPTVTNCPANLVALGPVVVTQVVPVSSTTYICPAVTTMVATPVACNCAYASSTATVYSMSGTSAVVVKTTVIAVPSGSATAYTATTVTGTGAAITTAPMTVTGSTATGTSTGGLVKFTGAASNVKAGMGLVAGVAGLAFML